MACPQEPQFCFLERYRLIDSMRSFRAAEQGSSREPVHPMDIEDIS